MDDFSAAGLLVLILAAFIFTSFKMGEKSGVDSLIDNCRTYQKFEHNDKLYSCGIINYENILK